MGCKILIKEWFKSIPDHYVTCLAILYPGKLVRVYKVVKSTYLMFDSSLSCLHTHLTVSVLPLSTVHSSLPIYSPHRFTPLKKFPHSFPALAPSLFLIHLHDNPPFVKFTHFCLVFPARYNQYHLHLHWWLPTLWYPD